MKEASTIAVIGAGLAGLSCASALQAAGHQVTVFEKSRGAGGRMSTKRGENADGTPWQCDIGAQYFTARTPSFQAELQHWLAAGVAALWAPDIRVFGERPASSSTPEEHQLPRYVGTPRMTAPARHLARTLAVHTRSTVQALRRDGAGWQLNSTEQGWLDACFDAVVLAVPAPQAVPLLQPVHDGMSGIAASVRMRGSWALMLEYDTPVVMPFEAAFVNAGPLRWIAQDSHKPGRRGRACWLLHAQASWSDAHIEDSAESVAQALLKAFSALGGPAPDRWRAHRWRYADCEQPLQLGAVWEASDGLGLCGDWLNGGKIEGAWLSGQRLATKMQG